MSSEVMLYGSESLGRALQININIKVINIDSQLQLQQLKQ